MRKELSYFTIQREFGGNQDWFTNVVMHVGGCAAATACDSCIYLAREFGMKELYPFDADNLTKEDYIAFSQKMKPYLRPRIHGVNKLWMFTEGFGNYLRDMYGGKAKTAAKDRVILSESMEEFSGNHSWKEARDFLQKKLNRGIPVPYLMLRHKDKERFEDFIWHWFLVVGYEAREGKGQEQFFIRTATYGEETWLNLEELWNTGEDEKGGLIGYEIISEDAANAKI